jgi:hypothetical protein
MRRLFSGLIKSYVALRRTKSHVALQRTFDRDLEFAVIDGNVDCRVTPPSNEGMWISTLTLYAVEQGMGASTER